MFAWRSGSLLVLLALFEGCADGERDLRRDAGRVDAHEGPEPDAYVPPPDAFVRPGVDAPVTPPDAFAPGTDAWSASPDAVSTGAGRYLDRCARGADCATGLCTPDRGGTSFCTRTCSTDLECAHEHLCVAGVCLPDDTGEPCSIGAPESCSPGLCLGGGAGGACTRACSSAAECPAGFACTRAGGSATKICVDIERPCAAAADCGSGLCVPTLGCTSECDTAADCPGRYEGLPGYTCARAYGSSTNVCVIPSDVVGDDAAGSACVFDPTGFLYECRSGACDDAAPLGPTCTTGCTAQGGCGPGLGCYPLPTGGSISLVCSRAGGRDLGSSCGSGRECTSALCDTAGYCTRLCNDGLCPTGWRCEPVAGFGIALCRR
jgi:hypothetical protein